MNPLGDSETENKLAQSLYRLEQLRKRHLTVGDALFRLNANMYMFDLYTLASLNRSMCLLTGFRSLIEAENFVAAAPLVRVQTDTYLRYSASALVADVDTFALSILQGIPVRDQKDRQGQRMTDAYLVEQTAKIHPWITDLYRNASGYVHLSEQHYFNAMTVAGESRLLMKVSDKDRFLNTTLYWEATQAFGDVTSLLLGSMRDWVLQKARYSNAAPLDADRQTSDASGDMSNTGRHTGAPDSTYTGDEAS